MTLIFCLLFANSASATFSIVGYDPATGDLGVAVASKFLAVGSVVPWAQAGVGAVATQAWANVDYGPEGLRRMGAGEAPETIVGTLTKADPNRDRRQVGMVDAKGQVAAFTGADCYAWAGHKTGAHFAVQGNILAGGAVLEAMAQAFLDAQKQSDHLADWLMAALLAGDKAGGDRRGRQSAAILVVRKNGGYDGGNDLYIDFRVDDHSDPVPELARVLKLRRR
ncbi:MAG: putative Ntn-hydrolase superfamily protein [Rhodothermales bacterium]|jgi:uncharacterized Ntn-hydrolase superfamily protein